MSLTVGVLVTNYDCWDLALACVQANLELCGEQLTRIMLLDNCSNTVAPAVIDSRVELVRNSTNLGLAKSINKGFELLGTDIVIHFDADARPLTDFVRTVVDEFSHDPAMAMLGFLTVDETNRATAAYDKEPNPFCLILGQKLYAKFQRYIERDEERLCPYMCAVAFRRTAFEELGKIDEQFEVLDVDIDFAMRVHRSNWKVKVHPQLVAFHKGGGSPMLTSERLLRYYKSRWYLLRKHNKISNPRLVKAVILLRLQVEYLLLRAMGSWLYKNTVERNDKLDGRRRLIRYCRDNY